MRDQKNRVEVNKSLSFQKSNQLFKLVGYIKRPLMGGFHKKGSQQGLFQFVWALALVVVQTVYSLAPSTAVGGVQSVVGKEIKQSEDQDESSYKRIKWEESLGGTPLPMFKGKDDIRMLEDYITRNRTYTFNMEGEERVYKIETDKKRYYLKSGDKVWVPKEILSPRVGGGLFVMALSALKPNQIVGDAEKLPFKKKDSSRWFNLVEWEEILMKCSPNLGLMANAFPTLVGKSWILLGVSESEKKLLPHKQWAAAEAGEHGEQLLREFFEVVWKEDMDWIGGYNSWSSGSSVNQWHGQVYSELPDEWKNAISTDGFQYKFSLADKEKAIELIKYCDRENIGYNMIIYKGFCYIFLRKTFVEGGKNGEEKVYYEQQLRHINKGGGMLETLGIIVIANGTVMSNLENKVEAGDSTVEQIVLEIKEQMLLEHNKLLKLEEVVGWLYQFRNHEHQVWSDRWYSKCA